MTNGDEAVLIKATDTDVLATLVHKRLSLNVPAEWVEEIISAAVAGNGPAQYMIGTWWKSLQFEAQANYWFEQAPCKQHLKRLEISFEDCSRESLGGTSHP